MTQAQTDNESANKLLAQRKSAKQPEPVPAQPPAVTPGTDLALAETGNWGAIEAIEATDLLVPKIFHQQATSKFVADGNARPGDFCDSISGEVLATKDSKLSVIVFGLYKTMIITKQEGQSWKLVGITTVLPENARELASKPLTEEIGGVTYKNNLTYNFYCLIAGKEGELPYVLSLGSTKTKAAKKLGNMLYKLDQAKRPGASVVFDLASIAEKNEKGSWFGIDITQGRASTQAELLRAHAWYLKSKSQKFAVVEEDASTGDAEHDDDIPF